MMTYMAVYVDSKGKKLTPIEAAILGQWHVTQMLGRLFDAPQNVPAPDNADGIEIISVIPTNFNPKNDKLGVKLFLF